MLHTKPTYTHTVTDYLGIVCNSLCATVLGGVLRAA